MHRVWLSFKKICFLYQVAIYWAIFVHDVGAWLFNFYGMWLQLDFAWNMWIVMQHGLFFFVRICATMSMIVSFVLYPWADPWFLIRTCAPWFGNKVLLWTLYIFLLYPEENVYKCSSGKFLGRLLEMWFAAIGDPWQQYIALSVINNFRFNMYWWMILDTLS